MSTKKTSDIHQRKIQKEIKKQQSRLEPTIPNQSFKRVVQEIMQDNHANEMNFRVEAISALQVASEEMLTDLFDDSRKVAAYTGRDTVNHHDMRFSMGYAPAGRGWTEEPQYTYVQQVASTPEAST